MSPTQTVDEILASYLAPLDPPPPSTDAPRQRKVLVVEDDQALGEFITEALGRKGYQVHVVPNGLDALRRLELGQRPEVILLDVLMPVMDGLQLLAEMRRAPGLASIPVVLLTGYAGPRLPDVVVERLQKPFGADALLDAVQRACATNTPDGTASECRGR
jgi:CheY-like chemotaxis protein